MKRINEIEPTKMEESARLFALLEAVGEVLESDLARLGKLRKAIMDWQFDMEAELNELAGDADADDVAD